MKSKRWLILVSDEDGSARQVMVFKMSRKRIIPPKEGDPEKVLDFGISSQYMDPEYWVLALTAEGVEKVYTGTDIFMFRGTWDERQCELIEYRDKPVRE